jgi:dTMP kinase
MSGLFIVFEGIDGTGKSTLCAAVAERLTASGIETEATAEPTRSEIGSMIRDGRVKGITQEAEALLFVADRAMHTLEMSRLREAGVIVLCDRYYPSTLAYQAAPLNGVALDMDWLWTLNAPVVREPDMTFVLDMDPEDTLVRVGGRGAKSKYETLEYLRNVRRNYLRLAEERGYRVVDASRTKDEVLDEVFEAIMSKV